MKYFDHNILAIAFSTPINSYSFEMFPVIFFFGEAGNWSFTQVHRGSRVTFTVFIYRIWITDPPFYKLTWHQCLKWSSTSAFPRVTSTRVLVLRTHICLVYSHVWLLMPPPCVCLGFPWHSWTSVLPLCGGIYVPAPLVGTVFCSHCIAWRFGQRPGWLLSRPDSLGTPVAHFIVILS